MRSAGICRGLIAAVIVAFSAAMPAVAQDLLTVEELKSCLVMQRDLEEQRARLGERSEELNRNAARLDRIDEQVSKRRAHIEPYDPRIAEKYERLREHQHQLYDIYAEDSRVYNADVADYNGKRAEYDRRCGSKRYNETNMIEAKRELGMP